MSHTYKIEHEYNYLGAYLNIGVVKAIYPYPDDYSLAYLEQESQKEQMATCAYAKDGSWFAIFFAPPEYLPEHMKTPPGLLEVLENINSNLKLIAEKLDNIRCIY